MNTQEQAYINGFVKRAMEYGLSEKQAMTLSAAKNLLRMLKNEGVNLVRDPNKLRSANIGVPSGTPKDIRSTYKELRKGGIPREEARRKIDDARELINESASSGYESAGAGPHYNAITKDIFIPRKDWIDNNFFTSSLLGKYSPRSLLFHEGGHAIHGIEDNYGIPNIFSQLLTTKDSTFEKMRNTLSRERIANNNAIYCLCDSKECLRP
jgi:hypothetical protein